MPAAVEHASGRRVLLDEPEEERQPIVLRDEFEALALLEGGVQDRMRNSCVDHGYADCRREDRVADDENVLRYDRLNSQVVADSRLADLTRDLHRLTSLFEVLVKRGVSELAPGGRDGRVPGVGFRRHELGDRDGPNVVRDAGDDACRLFGPEPVRVHHEIERGVGELRPAFMCQSDTFLRKHPLAVVFVRGGLAVAKKNDRRLSHCAPPSAVKCAKGRLAYLHTIITYIGKKASINFI